MVLLFGLTPCWVMAEELLTPEQRSWVSAHPIIQVAPDPDFPPIEYFDEKGKYKGIAADYLKILQKKLDIQFEIVALKDWNTVLAQAKTKEIDMFAAAAATPQRREYMNFTAPHIELPGAILVSDKVDGSNLSMQDLKGLRVAVVDGYVWEDLIANDYPDIELVPVPGLLNGLQALSFGSVDAMVANLAIATYYIKKSGITNLRVAGESGYFGRYAFGVRDDWPQLIPILEAGMAAITPEEHAVILDRWVRVEQPSLFDSRLFWISLLATLITILIVATLLWNRQLKRQVIQRSEELTKSLQLQLQAEQALHGSQQRYAMLFNQANDGIFSVNVTSGEVLDCNAATCQQFGCTKESFMKMSPFMRSPTYQPNGDHSVTKAANGQRYF
jgi:ABC-type amino acid transport substrate-binding protein